MNKNDKCIIVAISGASASGKSLLAHTIYRELKEEFKVANMGIIAEDSYYKDQTHLSMEDRIKTNYDHPNSMDHDLLLEHIKKLKAGESIDMPQYDYVEHTRKKDTINYEPKALIIVEGILLLTDEKLRKEFDMSIFVDTALDICFIRRLQRDIIERGRSMESVISQYEKTVRPMFLEFIEPSKQYADIIVPRGGKNRIAIDILKAQISSILS